MSEVKEKKVKKLSAEAKAKKEAKEALEKRIASIKKVAEEIHPDRWDFFELESGDYNPNEGTCKYRLTIHFPEVTIQNSDGESHEIHDMFLAWYFTAEANPTASWYGTRTTITYPEYCSNYMHSHMSGGVNPGFSGMCLGSGEVPRALISLVDSGYSEGKFTKALLLMYSYVAWESLGGGPYRYMRDVRETSRISGGTPNEAAILQVYKKCLKDKDNLLKILPIQHTVGIFPKFIIDADSLVFAEFLKKHTRSQDLYLKDYNGEYLSIQIDSIEREQITAEVNTQTLSKRDTVMFRGEVQKYGILELPQKQNEGTIVPHKSITTEVAKLLEQNINEYYLKSQQI